LQETRHRAQDGLSLAGRAWGFGARALGRERQIRALPEPHGATPDLARALGRAPSTVSRELRRNTAAHDRAGYDGDLAHSRARARATRTKPGKLQVDKGLCTVIQERLEME